MKRLALVCTILMAFAGAAFAQSDLQVLAVIKLNKNESITVKQLKTRVEAYQKQTGKVFTVDEKKQILDALIDEKLVMQAAQKAGISIPDSSVDQYFLQTMSQQVGKNVTEQELNTLVMQQTKMSLDDYMKQQAGMTVSEYKDYLKAQLTAQQYIVSQRQNELKAVAPSDEDIRSFFEMHKSSFVWSDMIKIFLVYVPKGAKPEDAKAKATELLNAYKDKKMTRDQITVKSKADGSGYQAGEMLINKTESSASQLGVPFKDLIDLFSKDTGYVSDLQNNANNCQFYVVIDKYAAKLLSLSDVVQPGTTVTVYDYIKQNLSQQKQMEYLQNAATEISKSLDTTDNVDRKKTGADLDKLLNWEGK
jgi:hypothetical protein